MKIGYYLRTSNYSIADVYLGSTYGAALDNFEAKFPDSWGNYDWWIEYCLYVDSFGCAVWSNVDESDRF